MNQKTVPPCRIQLSRRRGWRLPPDTVVVARPTRWGNPFRVGFASIYGPVPDRATAVGFYRRALLEGRLSVTKREIGERLAGLNLACWCPLNEPCHADVLLECLVELKTQKRTATGLE